jgi:hypothetical protein
VNVPLANAAIAIWLALAAAALFLLHRRHAKIWLLALLVLFQAMWLLLRGATGFLGVAGSTAASVALFFLIAYLAGFGEPPSLLRRTLGNAAYVFDAAVAVVELFPRVATWIPTPPLEVALSVTVLAACALAYAAGQEQRRLAELTIGPIALVVLAMLAARISVLTAVPTAVTVTTTLEAIATILAPIGFIAGAAAAY